MGPLGAVGCLMGGAIALLGAMSGGDMSKHRIARRVNDIGKEGKSKVSAKIKVDETTLSAPQIVNMLALDKGVLAKTKEGQIYLIVDLVSPFTVKALNTKGKYTLVPIIKLFEYHDPHIKTLGEEICQR